MQRVWSFGADAFQALANGRKRGTYPFAMATSKVAIVRTSPATVLEDYHRVMNLAGYQDVVDKTADTALKINISLALLLPRQSSTTPWQLEGVIRAMKQDGYDRDLIHGCHNRTVVIDAHLGERENKQIDVIEAHGLRNVHLYEGEEWINVRDAVGDLTEKFLVPERGLPQGLHASRSASSARTSSTCRRSRPTSSPPPPAR